MAGEPSVTAEVRDGAIVVSISAAKIRDLDYVKALDASIRRAIEMDETLPVVLDFAAVTYVSSAFIGELVELRRILKKAGRLFCLAGLRPEIERVFIECKLNAIFHLSPSVAEALTHVPSNRQRE